MNNGLPNKWGVMQTIVVTLAESIRKESRRFTSRKLWLPVDKEIYKRPYNPQ